MVMKAMTRPGGNICPRLPVDDQPLNGSVQAGDHPRLRVDRIEMSEKLNNYLHFPPLMIFTGTLPALVVGPDSDLS